MLDAENLQKEFNCYFNHAVITTAYKHKNRFAIQMSEGRKIYVVVINSLSKWVPFSSSCKAFRFLYYWTLGGQKSGRITFGFWKLFSTMKIVIECPLRTSFTSLVCLILFYFFRQKNLKDDVQISFKLDLFTM